MPRACPETRMTPEEVGRIMGIGADEVKAGIIQKAFAAWGYAIDRGSTYRYIIPRQRFLAWWHAQDLRGQEVK